MYDAEGGISRRVENYEYDQKSISCMANKSRSNLAENCKDSSEDEETEKLKFLEEKK